MDGSETPRSAMKNDDFRKLLATPRAQEPATPSRFAKYDPNYVPEFKKPEMPASGGAFPEIFVFSRRPRPCPFIPSPLLLFSPPPYFAFLEKKKKKYIPKKTEEQKVVAAGYVDRASLRRDVRFPFLTISSFPPD